MNLPFRKNKKESIGSTARKKRLKAAKKNKSTLRSGPIEREKRKRSNRIKAFIELNDVPNLQIIALVVLFLVGGLLMIFSASAYYAGTGQNIESQIQTEESSDLTFLDENTEEDGIINYEAGDAFFFFKRQIIWIILGTAIGYIFYITPLERLKKASPILLGVGVLMLIYIIPEALFGRTLPDGTTSGLQMPFVEALNGAPRWINLQFTNFQPSEYVKFMFILYIATWLVKKDTEENDTDVQTHFNNVMIPFLTLLGAISVMILMQRDFDTTVIMVLAIMVVYFLSGTSRVHTLGTLAILSSSFIFGVFALMLEGYRKSRVTTFFHIFQNGPNSASEVIRDGGFQVFNGLVGLASGFLFGKGYGESVIKQGYLQEAAYTDSIFSVIGEEFGLFGTLIVTIGFLYFASLGLHVALNAKTKFGALIAAGMTSLIVIQGFLNIAAVAVIIPFGGMPLPFFTYGGSSTIMTLIGVGVILNVSRRQNQK